MPNPSSSLKVVVKKPQKPVAEVADGLPNPRQAIGEVADASPNPRQASGDFTGASRNLRRPNPQVGTASGRVRHCASQLGSVPRSVRRCASHFGCEPPDTLWHNSRSGTTSRKARQPKSRSGIAVLRLFIHLRHLDTAPLNLPDPQSARGDRCALSMNRVAQPSRLRVYAASRRVHHFNRAGRPGNPQAGTPAPQLRFKGRNSGR